MSGRTVWHRDGERVTGFRKTARRQRPSAPATPEQLRDWRLSFLLPAGISVPPGYDHGLIGLTVETIGESQRLEVLGKNRDWVLGQGAAFVRRIAQTWRGHIVARLVKETEPGPTVSGPPRRGEEHVVEIQIDNQGAIAVSGATMQRIDFPAPNGKVGLSPFYAQLGLE